MILSLKDLTGREHTIEAIWVANHISKQYGGSTLVPTGAPDEARCDIITRLTWDMSSFKVVEATPEEQAALESFLDE